MPGITLTIVGDLDGEGQQTHGRGSCCCGSQYVGSRRTSRDLWLRACVRRTAHARHRLRHQNVLALQHGLPVVTSAEGFEGFSTVDESLPEDASPIVVAGSAQEFADKIIDLHGEPASVAPPRRQREKYVRNTLTVEATLPAVRDRSARGSLRTRCTDV